MSNSGEPLSAIYKQTEDRMQKAVEATRAEFMGIRTGRATPALLDRLHVEAYGAFVPLNRSRPSARPTRGRCRSPRSTAMRWVRSARPSRRAISA